MDSGPGMGKGVIGPCMPTETEPIPAAGTAWAEQRATVKMLHLHRAHPNHLVAIPHHRVEVFVASRIIRCCKNVIVLD